LKVVKQRGELNCGVSTGLAGFSLADAQGNYTGLDVDTCRAIAAAVLGGCSLRGGEGSILGIVIGTALLQVLQNLVNLLGIPSALNFSVMGAVIFFGVLVDQLLRARRTR
jgi:ribose/xylose/arabinose/galactoside ABC-type transport system permease subunit